MRTIFKYDANNFMRNEINAMPNKRRRRIFKLMNLLGNFTMKTNLYVDCSEMDDNVKVITYDKDGNKVTFYPRSINKDLENLVLIDEFKHSEAYTINNGVINMYKFEALKYGDVYYFDKGIILINNGMVELELENGLTYIAEFELLDEKDFCLKFPIAKFIDNLNSKDKLTFVDFKFALIACVKNVYKIKASCYENKELCDTWEIDYNNLYQEVLEDSILQRIKK